MKIQKILLPALFGLCVAAFCRADEPFSLAVGTLEHPHTKAIVDGAIHIPECRISYSTFTPAELQRRFDQGSAGDVIEVDIVSYIKRFSNEEQHDWILVPVFLTREFPHHHIYGVPDGRVAVKSSSESLLEWSRGILASSPTFKPLGAWDQSILSSAVVLAPVFADSRIAEQEYFKETRIFPILTVLAVRRELVEANPWLPEALFIAFTDAKAHTLEAGTLPLPWGPEHRDETIALMHENYWSYGVKNNPKTLEALFKYAREQGVTSRDLTPEDLFAAETLQLIDEKGAKN